MLGAFNTSNDPHLFFFLLRTCRNGRRFNQGGEFNSRVQRFKTWDGSQRVQALAEDWHHRLASKDVASLFGTIVRSPPKRVTFSILTRPTRPGSGAVTPGRSTSASYSSGSANSKATTCSRSTASSAMTTGLKFPADLCNSPLLLDNGVNTFDLLHGREPRLVTDSLYIKRRATPIDVSCD